MIRYVVNAHIKQFKRHPIVITVTSIYCLIYMVARCKIVYLINHDIEDFLVEAFISYFASFYFVPTFFDRNKSSEQSKQLLDKMRKEEVGGKSRSLSRHHSSSLSSRYDHNRNSPSSSLHNSSLGRGFF